MDPTVSILVRTSSSHGQEIMLPSSYDRKVVSMTFLLSLAFIVAFVTNIGSILIIFKLGLRPGNNIFEISPNNNELTINQDTILDKVFILNKVKGLDRIYGNSHFSASTSDSVSNKNQGAHISLMNDRFILQGKHLLMIDDVTNNYIEPLTLNAINQAIVSPGTTSLSSPNGIKNVKRIRSATYDDLEVESNSNLILSGNLGVKAVGVKLSVNSNNMRIYSRNSEVNILSHHSIQFPYLSPSAYNDTEYQTSNKFQETNSLLSLYQLCICRNGNMFKIRKRDETESCTGAKFPISANPCL